MLLYGAIFGCLSPVLSIASILSYKPPFVYPKDEKHNVERAKLALLSNSLDMPANKSEGDEQSDHLLMVVAYSKWVKIELEKCKRAAQQFCRTYFLNSSVMYMIRRTNIADGIMFQQEDLSLNVNYSDEGAGIYKIRENASEPEVMMAGMTLE